MASVRSTRFAFIVYPDDSRTENFVNFLESLHVPCCISPLHDSDLEESGELKKKHYHCILEFSSLKSYQQVLNLLEPLGIQHVESVEHRDGYVRYLCHLDSMEKVKYSIDDVVTLSGFDASCLLYANADDVSSIRQDIIRFCDSPECFSLKALWRILEANDCDSRYFDYVASHAYFLNVYIKS